MSITNLPQANDRNVHTLSQENPFISDRISEEVHQSEDVLSELAVVLGGEVVLGVVESHRSLPKGPGLRETALNGGPRSVDFHLTLFKKQNPLFY